MADSFFSRVENPNTVITPIDTAIRFPEILEVLLAKYREDIDLFAAMVAKSSSSAELLDQIRQKSVSSAVRMSLLKIFRRAVAPVGSATPCRADPSAAGGHDHDAASSWRSAKACCRRQPGSGRRGRRH